MAASDAVDFIDFTNSREWETWLMVHSDQQGEAWLRIAKKGSGIPSITIQEALDSALCYGWIDSHRRSFDERYYLQRYSPRRSKSPWSFPPDLAAALEDHAQAKQAFHQLDKTTQYTLFLPILKAATAEVRSSRLRNAIASLEETR